MEFRRKHGDFEEKMRGGNEKKTRLGLVNSEKCASFAIANEEQRVLLTNITPQNANGALVQLVRIHACHAWGHGFESRTHRNVDLQNLEEGA